ncbi:MAG: pilus assembly protein PilM [Pseudomonadota bacterium]
MARVNDISSTEKLLDLIRKKGHDVRPAAPPGGPLLSLPPPKKSLKRSFSFKIVSSRNTINVGVDIGHEALRMVRMARTSPKQWTLTGYETAPLNRETRRGTPEFINLLKSELTRFCGSEKNINIWAIMSAANVSVRHIRVPRIAKSQVENTVFWSIKKETPFNEKETLLDFEILEEIVEEGAPKWLVMAYTAPSREVQEIRGLFSKAGLPLAGISIVPFAIQNVFRTGWIPAMEGNVASLFIGNDFSRIDIYSRGNLIMTRGIKAGINSMVESLLEALQDRDRDAPDSEEPGKTPAASMAQARKILFSLSPDSEPLKAQDAGFELTEEMKFEIIEPALERLARQVERTFEHFKANIGQDKVNRLFVTSAMNVYPPLIAYVGEQLGIEADVLNPFRMDSPLSDNDGRMISLSERISLLPALGMALSDNAHTPNLLFTAKNKRQVVKIARVNRILIAISAAAALASVGIFLYGFAAIEKKKSELTGLQKQLAQYQPRIEKQNILQMISAARTQKFSSGAYSERYQGMAVIGELSALTPANVRLISLKTDFGALLPDKDRDPVKTPATAEKKGAAKEPPKETAAAVKTGNIVLEGFIFGNRRTLESSLAGYIIQLQSSPAFRQVTIQRNNIERFQEKDILRFSINMKLA